MIGGCGHGRPFSVSVPGVLPANMAASQVDQVEPLVCEGAAEQHAAATKRLSSAIEAQQLHVASLAEKLAVEKAVAAKIAANRDEQTAVAAKRKHELRKVLRAALAKTLNIPTGSSHQDQIKWIAKYLEHSKHPLVQLDCVEFL